MIGPELRELLEATTYEKLAEQEAAQAENLSRILGNVPLGIYVGLYLPILWKLK